MVQECFLGIVTKKPTQRQHLAIQGKNVLAGLELADNRFSVSGQRTKF